MRIISKAATAAIVPFWIDVGTQPTPCKLVITYKPNPLTPPEFGTNAQSRALTSVPGTIIRVAKPSCINPTQPA
jgi:hypothetical protein